MDVWRLIAGVVRRWYVIVPLLAVSLVGALLGGSMVDAEYRTAAVFSFVPRPAPVPPSEDAVESPNPLGNSATAAVALEYVLNSSATRQSLAGRGLSADYELAAVTRSSIVGVEVRANDPEVAIATAEALIAEARAELTRRQDAVNVPVAGLLDIDILDEPDAVTTSTGGQLQTAAAFGFVGVLLSFLATVLVDDIMIMRRRRRAEDEAVETDSSAGTGVQPEPTEPPDSAGRVSRTGPTRPPLDDGWSQRPVGLVSGPANGVPAGRTKSRPGE